jgi:NAD(P)-dependent dehydrogenase (short-subunit alcohol dehydrogenase family)
VSVDRVVVVTGASAGVGRATVRAFADRGAHVGLLARGVEGLRAATEEVVRTGARAVAVRTDVADAAQVDAAADEVERVLGPIDVWVNGAMTSVFAPLSDMTADEYRRVTEVTYLGSVFGTMAALRRMRPRDRGVIVQVGSALAYRGIPLQTAYCGAKHAVQGFTEALRAELLHERSGVRITMVQLPALNTPQFDWVKSALPKKPQPVPPIYQPEVAARAILWAAEHPERREYWVGGSTAATLVANAIVPGLLDRYLGRTGFESQQSDEREDPDRLFNLWEPVPGDAGARGRFDSRSRERSLQLWATTHRAWLAAGAAAMLVARALTRRRGG